MNPGFLSFLGSRPAERRELFETAGRRLRTSAQNIEKDFWVTWTLELLYNGLPAGHPRFLFKGGTSLSKGYGLISRFSEDIDITVFRDDLGLAASVEELETMSRKKRQARLDEIRGRCAEYIREALLPQFQAIAQETLTAARIDAASPAVVLDPADRDGQTLLFWYPSVTTQLDDYVRPAIKIESGAKSVLDPHQDLTVRPYIAEDAPALALTVGNVTTVVAERTFWDKVVILHGIRSWFDRRGVLRNQGQRISRHYYDVHRLLEAGVRTMAAGSAGLAEDCAAHARMFFNSPDLDLASAVRGSFSLRPSDEMRQMLREDYRRMAGMIIGDTPDFDGILNSVALLEAELNG